MPTYKNIKTGKTASFDKKKPRLERSDRWVEVKGGANGTKKPATKPSSAKTTEGKTTEDAAPSA